MSIKVEVVNSLKYVQPPFKFDNTCTRMKIFIIMTKD